MEGEQQRRENLQPAAGEGHALLLGPDQGHSHGTWEKPLGGIATIDNPRNQPLLIDSLCFPAWSPGEGLQLLHRHAQQQSGG